MKSHSKIALTRILKTQSKPINIVSPLYIFIIKYLNSEVIF